MSDDERVGTERIDMPKAVELLFNDSSKNFSELKSRQWTATTLSVAAIMAIAVHVHDSIDNYSPCLTFYLLLLIVICHFGVTWRCHTNLDVFRERIKKLISCGFTKESRRFFEGWDEARKGWDDARKEKKELQFKDALVDEGSIEFMIFAIPPVTLAIACVVIFGSWHAFMVVGASLLVTLEFAVWGCSRIMKKAKTKEVEVSEEE